MPIGPNISSPADRAHLFIHNARRLEVLRNCISFVFENKISDARKVRTFKFGWRIWVWEIHVYSQWQHTLFFQKHEEKLFFWGVGFGKKSYKNTFLQIFPAVLRALKGKVARLALVDELSYHVQSNRAMLEHQQFDMVVRLLNCALQNESSMDENGIAAAILPLCTSFCRVSLKRMRWRWHLQHVRFVHT